MELTTERLFLRDMISGDIEKTVQDLSNPQILKYMISIPIPYSIEDARKFLKFCEEDKKISPRVCYDLRIALKEHDEVIGGIRLSLEGMDDGSAKLGYWIAEDQWRKGYASEAARCIVDFAFNDLGVKRIEACVTAENEGSRKLLEKLGFEFTETIKGKRKVPFTGKIHDEVVYELVQK